MMRIALASVLLACATSAAFAADNVIPVNTTNNCAGGGTRATTGSYDATTGAVNFTITTTACVDSNGNTHNGTVGVAGTAIAQSGSADTFTFDLVYSFNDAWSNATDSVSRVCTWTKNGNFNTSTDIFTGTVVKTNCTLTVSEKEAKGILEQALKKATSTEN